MFSEVCKLSRACAALVLCLFTMKRSQNKKDETFCSSYLALAFRDQPMEIWDLHSFRMLRRMSRACPVIVDMAWSGKHHQARTMRTKSTSAAADENGNNNNGDENQPPNASTTINNDKDDAQQQQEATSLNTNTNTTAVAAAPGDVANGKMKQTIYRENLVVLDNENHLYHVVVKGMHVKDGKEVNTQWATTSQVVSMVWKGDYLAFGDNDGRLSLWDLGTKQSRASTAQRGAVTQLRFSRAPRNYTLAVQHVDGVAVWDAVRFVQLHSVTVGVDLPVHVRLLDVDVCGWDSAIAMLTSDALLRLVSTHRWHMHAAMFNPTAIKRIFCAALLPTSALALLRLVFNDARLTPAGQLPVDFILSALINFDSPSINNIAGNSSSSCTGLDDSENDTSSQNCIPSADAEILCTHLNALENDFVHFLQRKTSVAERCARVALLLGDSWEHTLWTLVDYQLSTDPTDEQPYPPPYLDTFWKTQHYRRLQMLLRNRSDHVTSAATNNNSNSSNASNTPISSSLTATASSREAALALVALQQCDAAVQLLLTPATEPQAGVSEAEAADASYADCLLACLLSAEHSSTACQSTVKLVATNLIAAGKLTEGVLLLCLIGKCMDACRYLQSANQWRASVTLARTALPETECAHIVSKWAEHQLSPMKTLALLLFVSLGDWTRAVETLVGQRQIALAALLLNALKQRYGPRLRVSVDDAADNNHATSELLVPMRLQQEIYTEYARQIASIGGAGLCAAALSYCDLAGNLGVNVRAEIELLSSPKATTASLSVSKDVFCDDDGNE